MWHARASRHLDWAVRAGRLASRRADSCPTPPALCAEDGGQSWKRERAADSLAANLYELVFTTGGLGFVLGNDGVLLRVRVACR